MSIRVLDYYLYAKKGYLLGSVRWSVCLLRTDLDAIFWTVGMWSKDPATEFFLVEGASGSRSGTRSYATHFLLTSENHVLRGFNTARLWCVANGPMYCNCDDFSQRHLSANYCASASLTRSSCVTGLPTLCWNGPDPFLFACVAE